MIYVDDFRFELVSFALTAGDAFTIEQAAQVVSWRYKLAVTGNTALLLRPSMASACRTEHNLQQPQPARS